ncbi:MAG TPA: hypothetical protein VGG21_02190 [Acidimicrobiales bacterium]
MSQESIDSLVGDLLEWIGRGRPYAEVQEAWRTSCPRLPVWEDAVDAHFVETRPRPGGGRRVVVTAAGLDFLTSRGRSFVQDSRP